MTAVWRGCCQRRNPGGDCDESESTVMAAKAWNIQRREDIGHGSPIESPPGFDFDIWLGPAEEVPFQANRHHYDWHASYNFGCGGMGNDGIHHIDYARWGLGITGLPARVAAIGGKYFFDDNRRPPSMP